MSYKFDASRFNWIKNSISHVLYSFGPTEVVINGKQIKISFLDDCVIYNVVMVGDDEKLVEDPIRGEKEYIHRASDLPMVVFRKFIHKFHRGDLPINNSAAIDYAHIRSGAYRPLDIKFEKVNDLYAKLQDDGIYTWRAYKKNNLIGLPAGVPTVSKGDYIYVMKYSSLKDLLNYYDEICDEFQKRDHFKATVMPVICLLPQPIAEAIEEEL